MGEFKEIKCPYCFKKFKHDEVHFRLAEQTVDRATKAMLKAKTDEEKEQLKPYVKLSQIDPKYYEVWGTDRGGELMGRDRDLFNIPYVDHTNIKVMTVGSDYIRDKDGFVERIEDNMGRFESRTRICPHCHNKLPMRYGKYEQKFLSILGVSSSGKTVFVKQLLSRMQDSLEGDILSYVDGSFVELTLPVDDQEYIEENKPLPESTKTLNFKVPYFVTLTFNKNGKPQTYDFVIYDVAGETLIVEPGKENKFNFFAGYIKESDGIISLIDPMQLVSSPKPKYPASKMISTLFSVFGEAVDVPTAITLSKSDLLMTDNLIQDNLNPDLKYFNENSSITKNIPWNTHKKYFYKDEYMKLRAPLNKFFRNVAPGLNASVDTMFKKVNYFAIASLLEGVDQKLILELTPNGKWESSHMSMFAENFPVLERELKRLERNLEEQERYPDEDIIDLNSLFVEKAFVFEQSSPDCKKMDNILGKISTLTTRAEIEDEVFKYFDSDYEMVWMTELGKEERISADEFTKYIYRLIRANELYRFNMYIQGYPRKDGTLASLRIEEPLFWLLSEMDIIRSGNLFGGPEDKDKDGNTSESEGWFKGFFKGRK